MLFHSNFTFNVEGGMDLAGNPLLTFPVDATRAQNRKVWLEEDLVRLLCHMIDMAELITSRKSAAVLVDFQTGCSDNKMAMILQALQSIEVHVPFNIGICIFYIIPRSTPYPHAIDI